MILFRYNLYYKVLRLLTFFKDLAINVEADSELIEESGIVHNILTQLSRYNDDKNMNGGQKWKLPPNGQPVSLFSGNTTSSRAMIRPDDESKYFYILINLY